MRIILIIFIMFSCFGQEEPTVAIKRNVFTGMNSRQHPSLLSNHVAQTIINGDLTQLGRTKKRLGYELKANDVGDVCFTGFARFAPDGGDDVILGVEDTNLRYWTGSGNWSSPIHTDFTAGLDVLILVGNNMALVSDGVDNVHKVDSSLTVTDMGDLNVDPPKATVGVYFNNRFFMCVGDLMYYSDVVTAGADPVFDRNSNYFPINLGDNDDITNILPYSEDQLVIFKENSTWWLSIPTNVSPSTNWILKPIDNQFGCISEGAAVKAGDEIFYWARDGLRNLAKTEQDKLKSRQVPISNPIYNDYVDQINLTYKDVIRMVYFENRIITGVPLTGPGMDNWFVYFLQDQPSLNGFSIWEDISTRAFVKYPIDGREFLFFSPCDDGRLYRMFDGLDDDGVIVPFEMITRLEDFMQEGYGVNKKYGHSLLVKCETSADSTLKIEGQKDEAGFINIGTMDLDIEHPTLPIDLDFDLVGISQIQKKFSLTKFNHWYNFQLKFTQTEADMGLSLLNYYIISKPDRYQYDN